MDFELEPAKKIIGEHIYLEHPTPSFKLATEMFNVVDKNREHILPWLPWADVTITKTPENSYGFMTNAVSKWKNKTNFEILIVLFIITLSKVSFYQYIKFIQFCRN